MKLNRHFILLLSSLALVSCSDNDDPAPLPVQEINVTESLDKLSYTENVWSDASENKDLTLGDFTFSHIFGEYAIIEGFTPANLNSNKIEKPYYAQQFNIMPAGEDNNRPYIVANWSSYYDTADKHSLEIRRTDDAEFTPQSMQITNTAYAYYTMRDGNAPAKKFNDADWFKIVAHGVKADGSVVTADYYLARDGKILDAWTSADLLKLGTVKSIYFTMESSDNGDYGMNTPAYFAMRDFIYLMPNE